MTFPSVDRAFGDGPLGDIARGSRRRRAAGRGLSFSTPRPPSGPSDDAIGPGLTGLPNDLNFGRNFTDDQRARDQFNTQMRKYDAALNQPGLSDESREVILKMKEDALQESDSPGTASGFLGALGNVLMFLDRGRQTVQLGIADVFFDKNSLFGKDDRPEITMADYGSALSGDTAALLERLGPEVVGEHGVISTSSLLDLAGWKPGAGLINRVSRWLLSFGGDVATDPITALSFGGAGMNATTKANVARGALDDVASHVVEKQVAREFGTTATKEVSSLADEAIGKKLTILAKRNYDDAVEEVMTDTKLFDNIDDLLARSKMPDDEHFSIQGAIIDSEAFSREVWEAATRKGIHTPDEKMFGRFVPVSEAQGKERVATLYDRTAGDASLRRYHTIDADFAALRTVKRPELLGKRSRVGTKKMLPGYAVGGVRVGSIFGGRGFTIPGTRGLLRKTITEPLLRPGWEAAKRLGGPKFAARVAKWGVEGKGLSKLGGDHLFKKVVRNQGIAAAMIERDTVIAIGEPFRQIDNTLMAHVVNVSEAVNDSVTDITIQQANRQVTALVETVQDNWDLAHVRALFADSPVELTGDDTVLRALIDYAKDKREIYHDLFSQYKKYNRRIEDLGINYVPHMLSVDGGEVAAIVMAGKRPLSGEEDVLFGFLQEVLSGRRPKGRSSDVGAAAFVKERTVGRGRVVSGTNAMSLARDADDTNAMMLLGTDLVGEVEYGNVEAINRVMREALEVIHEENPGLGLGKYLDDPEFGLFESDASIIIDRYISDMSRSIELFALADAYEKAGVLWHRKPGNGFNIDIKDYVDEITGSLWHKKYAGRPLADLVQQIIAVGEGNPMKGAVEEVTLGGSTVKLPKAITEHPDFKQIKGRLTKQYNEAKARKAEFAQQQVATKDLLMRQYGFSSHLADALVFGKIGQVRMEAKELVELSDEIMDEVLHFVDEFKARLGNEIPDFEGGMRRIEAQVAEQRRELDARLTETMIELADGIKAERARIGGQELGQGISRELTEKDVRGLGELLETAKGEDNLRRITKLEGTIEEMYRAADGGGRSFQTADGALTKEGVVLRLKEAELRIRKALEGNNMEAALAERKAVFDEVDKYYAQLDARSRLENAEALLDLSGERAAAAATDPGLGVDAAPPQTHLTVQWGPDAEDGSRTGSIVIGGRPVEIQQKGAAGGFEVTITDLKGKDVIGPYTVDQGITRGYGRSDSATQNFISGVLMEEGWVNRMGEALSLKIRNRITKKRKLVQDLKRQYRVATLDLLASKEQRALLSQISKVERQISDLRSGAQAGADPELLLTPEISREVRRWITRLQKPLDAGKIADEYTHVANRAIELMNKIVRTQATPEGDELSTVMRQMVEEILNGSATLTAGRAGNVDLSKFASEAAWEAGMLRKPERWLRQLENINGEINTKMRIRKRSPEGFVPSATMTDEDRVVLGSLYEEIDGFDTPAYRAFVEHPAIQRLQKPTHRDLEEVSIAGRRTFDDVLADAEGAGRLRNLEKFAERNAAIEKGLLEVGDPDLVNPSDLWRGVARRQLAMIDRVVADHVNFAFSSKHRGSPSEFLADQLNPFGVYAARSADGKLDPHLFIEGLDPKSLQFYSAELGRLGLIDPRLEVRKIKHPSRGWVLGLVESDALEGLPVPTTIRRLAEVRDRLAWESSQLLDAGSPVRGAWGVDGIDDLLKAGDISEETLEVMGHMGREGLIGDVFMDGQKRYGFLLNGDEVMVAVRPVSKRGAATMGDLVADMILRGARRMSADIGDSTPGVEALKAAGFYRAANNNWVLRDDVARWVDRFREADLNGSSMDGLVRPAEVSDEMVQRVKDYHLHNRYVHSELGESLDLLAEFKRMGRAYTEAAKDAKKMLKGDVGRATRVADEARSIVEAHERLSERLLESLSASGTHQAVRKGRGSLMRALWKEGELTADAALLEKFLPESQWLRLRNIAEYLQVLGELPEAKSWRQVGKNQVRAAVRAAKDFQNQWAENLDPDRALSNLTAWATSEISMRAGVTSGQAKVLRQIVDEVINLQRFLTGQHDPRFIDIKSGSRLFSDEGQQEFAAGVAKLDELWRQVEIGDISSLKGEARKQAKGLSRAKKDAERMFELNEEGFPKRNMTTVDLNPGQPFRMFEEVNLGTGPLENAGAAPSIVEMFANYVDTTRGMFDPLALRVVEETTSKLVNYWKAANTIQRPTFHLRNAMSIVWSNMIIGLNPLDPAYALVGRNGILFRQALRRTNSVEEAIKVLPARVQPYFKAAHEVGGVLETFAVNELHNLVRGVKGVGDKGAYVRQMMNPFSRGFMLNRMGSRAMESIEDFGRMAAFVKHYDPNNHATALTARDMAVGVHFDYSDLTLLEEKIRNKVPFYVWTKRNLELQLRVAYERPEMIMRYHKLHRAASENFGGSDDETGRGWAGVPDWWGPFAASTDYYMNKDTPYWARTFFDFDLPPSDLIDIPLFDKEGFGFASTANYFGSMLGPGWDILGHTLNPDAVHDTVSPYPLGLAQQAADFAFGSLYDAQTYQDGVTESNSFFTETFNTMFPWWKGIVEPLMGPTDPGRAQRLGLTPANEGDLLARLRALAVAQGPGLGFRVQTPADQRANTFRQEEELAKITGGLEAGGVWADAADLQTVRADALREQVLRSQQGGFEPPSVTGPNADIRARINAALQAEQAEQRRDIVERGFPQE